MYTSVHLVVSLEWGIHGLSILMNSFDLRCKDVIWSLYTIFLWDFVLLSGIFSCNQFIWWQAPDFWHRQRPRLGSFVPQAPWSQGTYRLEIISAPPLTLQTIDIRTTQLRDWKQQGNAVHLPISVAMHDGVRFWSIAVAVVSEPFHLACKVISYVYIATWIDYTQSWGC